MNASELFFVGIDVSKDSLEMSLDDKEKTLCISNDEAGIVQVLDAVKLACEVRSSDAVSCAPRIGFS